MTGMHKALGVASAMLIATTGLLVTTGRAHADDPVMHHVKYTVTAQNGSRPTIDRTLSRVDHCPGTRSTS